MTSSVDLYAERPDGTLEYDHLTDEQKAEADTAMLARVAAFKKTYGSSEQFMQTVYAGRCIVDAMAGRNDDRNREFEVYAFLSIFHPEMDDADRRAFAQACQSGHR